MDRLSAAMKCLAAAPRSRKLGGCTSRGIEFDLPDQLNLQVVQSGPELQTSDS
jgi:hypothetical protein